MKIICIGRNYEKHIQELANEKPAEPVFFLKPDSAILPKNTPFFIPDFLGKVHYEVEVLIKINKVGKYIQEKFAHKYYDEIGLGIDFTARNLQKKLKEKGLPWEKAKAFDGSAVIGNFYPKTDFENIAEMKFSLLKQKKILQKGNTKNMIYKMDFLIAYVSKFMTLKKGDVFFTGTPSGVGAVQKEDILEGVLEKKTAFKIQVK